MTTQRTILSETTSGLHPADPAAGSHRAIAVMLILVAGVLGTTPGCGKESTGDSGTVNIEACGLLQDAADPWDTPPYSSECDTNGAGGPVLDFGEVRDNEPATKVLALYNNGTGDRLLTVDDVAVADQSGAGDAFTLSFFLVDSPGASPQPTTLPVSLRSTDGSQLAQVDVLYVQVDYDGSGATFPTDALEVRSDDGDQPTLTVDLVGTVNDCPLGTWDLNGDPSDGCEYQCDFVGSVDDCQTSQPDDNCDGVDDAEDADNCTTYYLDADGDGVGDAAQSRCLCAPDGDHTALAGGDCNDANDTVGDCSGLPNVAAASCSAGACTIDACAAGFANCDSDVNTGCDTNLDDPTTCGTTCGNTVDCTTQPAVDTDGADDAYTVGGTVTAYTGCQNGACATNDYVDQCNGDMLDEYGANGGQVVGPTPFDCSSLESLYCQDTQHLYRDEWGCSGSPGACTDVVDALETDCGVPSCQGTCGTGPNSCTYNDRGCATAACFDTSHDADDDAAYCTGCGQQWNLPGEVSSPCCGDDAGEHAQTCTDMSNDGDCGSTTAACCNQGTDCVDNGGDCRNTGLCHVFDGAGVKKSYCDAGTWRSPDAAQAYCTASGCANHWMTGASTCCGNDPGEDIEQAGTGNWCCYNGDRQFSGNYTYSVLCQDGELYDCNNAASDDGPDSLGVPANTAVPDANGLWCTYRDSWCALGTTDCSGDAFCETTLDNNAGTCGSTPVPNICANTHDVPMCLSTACEPRLSVTDRGEYWTLLQAIDCLPASCGTEVRLKIDLIVPVGVDYDLYLYTDCNNPPVQASASPGLGGNETITFTAASPTWVAVEVRYAGGVGCGDWSLNVFGGNC